MKIGIDYTAALKQGGGIGRYTRGLITTLAQLDLSTLMIDVLTQDSLGTVTIDRDAQTDLPTGLITFQPSESMVEVP